MTAIFNCGTYSNWQMNVYLTLPVKFNSVKFHTGNIAQTPHSARTCLAIQ